MKNLMLLLIFQTFSLALAGGVSSGGGGTLPSRPVSQFELTSIIEELKRDLRLILNFMEPRPGDPRFYSYEKKIWDGETTIRDLLERSFLQLEHDRPCYDFNGDPVDGSIYKDRPNTICISTFTIAPKIVKQQARGEVGALILHELSHLLGTNEDEADELQETVRYLLEEANDDSARLLSQKVSGLTSELVFALSSVVKSQADESASAVLEKIEAVNLKFRALLSAKFQIPFRSLNRRSYDYYFNLEVYRFLPLLWKQMSLSGRSDSSYWEEQYNKAFGGKKVISVGEMKKILSPIKDEGFHDDMLIKRVETQSEIMEAMSKILKDIKKLDDYYLHTLYFNGNIQELPGDKKPSEKGWTDFIGDYKVVHTECSQYDHTSKRVSPAKESPLSELKIFRRDGRLIMRKQITEGASAEGAIPGPILGNERYGFPKVAHNFVSWTGIQGNNFANRNHFDHTSWSLAKMDGRYQFSKVYTTYTGDKNYTIVDVLCRYDLEKLK